MKKEKRIRDIIIAIFVFFICLSHHIAVGEIKEVELGIDGLSCPFCVVGLRKQVERIETIENMDRHSIFLSPGLQYVTERFILEGSIQLPVIQDLNGSQLETDYIITIGTRITF